MTNEPSRSNAPTLLDTLVKEAAGAITAAGESLRDPEAIARVVLSIEGIERLLRPSEYLNGLPDSADRSGIPRGFAIVSSTPPTTSLIAFDQAAWPDHTLIDDAQLEPLRRGWKALLADQPLTLREAALLARLQAGVDQGHVLVCTIAASFADPVWRIEGRDGETVVRVDEDDAERMITRGFVRPGRDHRYVLARDYRP